MAKAKRPGAGGFRLPFKPSRDTCDAVETLLSAVVIYHRNTEETFLECLLCGEWEGHADGCPVPALERWQEDPTETK